MSESPLRPLRVVCSTGRSMDVRIEDPETGENLLPLKLPAVALTVAIGPQGFVETTIHCEGLPIDVAAQLSESTLAQLARQIADTRDMERSNAALAVLRMLSPQPAGGK